MDIVSSIVSPGVVTAWKARRDNVVRFYYCDAREAQGGFAPDHIACTVEGRFVLLAILSSFKANTVTL